MDNFARREAEQWQKRGGGGGGWGENGLLLPEYLSCVWRVQAVCVSVHVKCVRVCARDCDCDFCVLLLALDGPNDAGVAVPLSAGDGREGRGAALQVVRLSALRTGQGVVVKEKKRNSG